MSQKIEKWQTKQLAYNFKSANKTIKYGLTQTAQNKVEKLGIKLFLYCNKHFKEWAIQKNKFMKFFKSYLWFSLYGYISLLTFNNTLNYLK